MRYSIEQLQGRRVLLAASTGGHLTQLNRLAPRLGIDPDSPWLTFDTPQSRGLLAGRNVHYVPYVRPRDLPGVVRAAVQAQPRFREVTAGVSTGAALALAVLPQLAAAGKPAVYIESVSRVQGPSLSGRMLSHLPRIGLYCQHDSWSRPPWRLGPSVLSDYTLHHEEPRLPRTMFVTLGTIAPYRFDRLVDATLAYVQRHPDVEVVWQVGSTSRRDLPGRVVGQLGQEEFSAVIGRSDVVIAHAGVGVAISSLDRGHAPLLLDRRAGLNEHVDDHQHQIWSFLVSRGLAFDAQAALGDDDIMRRAVATKVRTGAIMSQTSESNSDPIGE